MIAARVLFPALFLLILLNGCNTLGRQPKFQDAAITPATLKPQDTALITVKVVDKHKVVHRIVGIVKEDPRIKLSLRDDGKAPDEKALDGIWTFQVDVPFQAPPGQFTLELTAFNSKGDAVQVKTADKQKGPLTATVTLVIEYPPDAPAPADVPATEPAKS